MVVVFEEPSPGSVINYIVKGYMLSSLCERLAILEDRLLEWLLCLRLRRPGFWCG